MFGTIENLGQGDAFIPGKSYKMKCLAIKMIFKILKSDNKFKIFNERKKSFS